MLKILSFVAIVGLITAVIVLFATWRANEAYKPRKYFWYSVLVPYLIFVPKMYVPQYQLRVKVANIVFAVCGILMGVCILLMELNT